ncbi:MAG: hypothetical protein M1835_007555, partial [Candelina submexicana]
MEVLVKDLCKPDVVAAIAKRRFFSIKDKPNMTPEIWEKFRDMIPSVHHTQPVDPDELEAKLRDCPPRSSAPPQPEDPWPEGYETPGPDPPEVRAEQHKVEAEEVYDTLIQMGGRPTRPIRPIPPWKKVLIQGDLCYRYAEEIEVLFHSSWHGNSRGLHSTLTEADYIAAHWAAECSQFREELRRWQGFLDDQQWRREHRPEFAREEEIERLRYPQDPHVTASLKKLKDWKEYLVYFQRTIGVSKKRIEAARRAVEAIQRKDPEVVANKGKVRRLGKRDWLVIIEREREEIAAEKKRLEWVKQQLPVVLSECTASLMGAPTACREMQERSELEAKRVFNTLVETGGRPTRPMRPVPCNQEREDTYNSVHVLCHWEAECSQFEEELREWRNFLDHRQKKEVDEVTVQEQQGAQTTTQVVLWKDYRAYQQMEVDHAKQWVTFSQQMKLDVEFPQKQVRSAEMRLEWVERQLSALLAERAVSTTAMSTFNRLEDQAKLPKRASRSGQTTLKNHRPNRFNKSGPRSNHDEKRNRVSAKVSKTADKKAP